ncbi:MAG: TetR/AcrR family transcriptional regulator [Clostridiaceae bacterium]
MPKSKIQCEQIKENTKQNIIDKSILYFSKNGFSGTKIRDLSNYIGIAQGSIYNYFESKESLYNEIFQIINSQDLKPMKQLVRLPISARKKVKILSEYLITELNENQKFAAVMTLSTQQILESDDNATSCATYQSEVYELLSRVVHQGQKEKTIVEGDVIKLVDYYWGVVYLYALKKLFTKNFTMIYPDDLSRILLK